MSEVWVPIIGSITLFGMIGFIFFVSARTRQRIEKMRSELQGRILDKFTSGAEFAEFARTPEGRRLLHGTTAARAGSHERLLGWMRNGLVISFLGMGFLLLSLFGLIADRGSIIVGTLLLSLGLGFLASALISRKLTRAWSAQELEEQPG